jgi:hypothetical protein
MDSLPTLCAADEDVGDLAGVRVEAKMTEFHPYSLIQVCGFVLSVDCTVG